MDPQLPCKLALSFLFIIGPMHYQKQQNDVLLTKTRSDQPWHTLSLIIVLAVHMKKPRLWLTIVFTAETLL